MILINNYSSGSVFSPQLVNRSKPVYYIESLELDTDVNTREIAAFIIDDLKQNISDNAEQFKRYLFSFNLKSSYDYSKLNTTEDFQWIYPTDSVSISYDFINKIEYDNIHEITSYLYNHQDITGIVINGCKLAVKSFHPNFKIKLELVKDLIDDVDILTIFIYFRDYDVANLALIDSINRILGPSIIGKSAWFMISSKYY